jgi:hypothetical protein
MSTNKWFDSKVLESIENNCESESLTELIESNVMDASEHNVRGSLYEESIEYLNDYILNSESKLSDSERIRFSMAVQSLQELVVSFSNIKNKIEILTPGDLEKMSKYSEHMAKFKRGGYLNNRISETKRNNIIDMHKTGKYSNRDIGRFYEVSPTTVGNILKDAGIK